MKISKYIKRLLFKEWAALILTFLIITLSTYVIAVNSFEPYTMFENSNPTFPITELTSTVIVFSIIMAVASFDYRYKLKRADTYYQLPIDDKKFRNIRVLTALGSVLGVYLITFIIGFILFVVKYYTSPDSYTFYNYTYYKAFFSPGGLILTGLVSMLGIVGNFFISCVACSITNKQINAIIVILIFNLFFGSIGPYTYQFVKEIQYLTGVNSDYLVKNMSSYLLLSPTFIGGASLGLQLSYKYVFPTANEVLGLYNQDNLIWLHELIQYTFFGLVSVSSILLTLLPKVPSGEKSGQPGTINKLLDNLIILPCVSMTIILGLGSTYFSISKLIYVILVASGEYLLMCNFFHTFKLKPKYFIAIGLSMVTTLAFSLLISNLFSNAREITNLIYQAFII